MSEKIQEQIDDWLKKLERESWQLELLVSAFTIFLLIGATENFGEFLLDVNYIYSFNNSLLGLGVFFLSLIYSSIKVLTAFLIIHLLLRGFWIGTIGLRSVQPAIEYEKLNYSEFFQKKLEKRIIGLDRLVVILDELCSVIFSLSFLIIFMLLSFGLFFLFFGVVAVVLDGLGTIGGESFENVKIIILLITALSILLTGIIYLIDYFTLGFFKKIKWFAKVYYPIYRFYGVITLSFISRSIYYNLISKYSKKKIRILYLIIAVIWISNWFVNFDQYQYFPEGDSYLVMENNYYDDARAEDGYVERVSVESKYVKGDFMSLFLRYNPDDNKRINSNCPDFEPQKNEGFNPRLRLIVEESGFFIRSEKFEDEDKEMLLSCLTDFYVIAVNDSVYSGQKLYFHEHPKKGQKGLLSVLSTEGFMPGENIVKVQRSYINPSDSSAVLDDFATFPVWFSK